MEPLKTSQRELIADQIFKMLELYPAFELEKKEFEQDILKLSSDTLLFLYQGIVQIEELTHK